MDKMNYHNIFRTNKHKLILGKKTYIVGILNLTPDSFSDGGKYIDLDMSIRKALDMVKEGADIIDIGGESTRPGYTPIDIEEESQRVIPVISALSKVITIPISIDTSKSIVAKKAILAGANIINDIWGLQRDPYMAEIAAKHNAGVIAMHNSNTNVYSDVISSIIDFLKKSIKIADNAGISPEHIILDPGIGFGKTPEINIEVMSRLSELKILNYPILLGVSRKSLIGHVLNLPVGERLEGSISTGIIGITKGIDFLRVHDVKETVRAAKMADAILRRQIG